MGLTVYLAFIIWVVILIAASFMIDKFLSRLVSRKIYRMIITPGIIVHELSHAIVCIFVRAKITRIRFFAESGGSVEHYPPKLPVIGRPLIGMAPLFGVTLSIFGLAYYFGFHSSIPPIDLSASFFSNISLLASSALKYMSFSLGDWQFWVFLYLLISLSASIAPSTVDLKQAAWGALIVIIVVGLLVYFNIGRNVISTVITDYLGWVIALGALFELLVLVVITPFVILKKFTGR